MGARIKLTDSIDLLTKAGDSLIDVVDHPGNGSGERESPEHRVQVLGSGSVLNIMKRSRGKSRLTPASWAKLLVVDASWRRLWAGETSRLGLPVGNAPEARLLGV